MKTLETIRAQLNDCDSLLLDALTKRMACVDELIAYKKAHGMPILQPKQEALELSRLHEKLSENPYLDEIEEIYRSVIDSSKRVQARRLFPRSIFLIGFMGCGKSSVAAYLSQMLAMETVEMDAVLVERAGMPIADIFSRYGEEYFRNLESNLIVELGEQKGLIVSCGGGVPMRAENVKNMKQTGRVVLLTASPKTIYERVKDDTSRPILNGNMNIPYIADLQAKRRPHYEAAADVTVETDRKSVLEICEELIEKICALEAAQT